MWSWYTGRWWVGCYIWYSEEGTGRGPSPPRPLFAVPNVTAHPSTASVPITVLLYNGSLLCGFNVPVKRLIRKSDFESRITFASRDFCLGGGVRSLGALRQIRYNAQRQRTLLITSAVRGAWWRCSGARKTRRVVITRPVDRLGPIRHAGRIGRRRRCPFSRWLVLFRELADDMS